MILLDTAGRRVPVTIIRSLRPGFYLVLDGSTTRAVSRQRLIFTKSKES